MFLRNPFFVDTVAMLVRICYIVQNSCNTCTHIYAIIIQNSCNTCMHMSVRVLKVCRDGVQASKRACAESSK